MIGDPLYYGISDTQGRKVLHYPMTESSDVNSLPNMTNARNFELTAAGSKAYLADLSKVWQLGPDNEWIEVIP